MKKLIAGNWKMTGDLNDARTLIADIVNGLDGEKELLEKADFLVCPPALHIGAVRHALHGFAYIHYGAQDVSAEGNGAHTGDLSASMVKDAGCSYVIVGHSERRADHGESDEVVATKAAAAIAADIVPIICVGETLEQRESGKALDVVSAQIKASIPEHGAFNTIVIAYEPVWAIGTGKVPSLGDIDEMHAHIRSLYKELYPEHNAVRVLYGGSLKPANAPEILHLDSVGGGLIGGASLKAESFLAIARAI